MIAFMVVLAASNPLSQLGIIVSIAAVIVPAAWWTAHRIKASVRAEFVQQMKDKATDTRVAELTTTLERLDTALRIHMGSEEETNAKIEALGSGLVEQLRRLEVHISLNQVNMMKAIMSNGDVPTMLHEVWPGGYKMLWANRSYLMLVGLSMSEALAGGEWMAIHADERDLVRQTAEHAGQTSTDYDGTYRLVDVKTQSVIGTFQAHGHCLKGPEDHVFFLSTLVPCDDLS